MAKIYHALKNVFFVLKFIGGGGGTCPLCHPCYSGPGQGTVKKISRAYFYS